MFVKLRHLKRISISWARRTVMGLNIVLSAPWVGLEAMLSSPDAVSFSGCVTGELLVRRVNCLINIPSKVFLMCCPLNNGVDIGSLARKFMNFGKQCSFVSK